MKKPYDAKVPDWLSMWLVSIVADVMRDKASGIPAVVLDVLGWVTLALAVYLLVNRLAWQWRTPGEDE